MMMMMILGVYVWLHHCIVTAYVQQPPSAIYFSFIQSPSAKCRPNPILRIKPTKLVAVATPLERSKTWFHTNHFTPRVRA